MSSVVVVGAQWGDEGKGKIVDILSEFADLVVRFQGGANAGHTLVVNEEEQITHLVPSGVMHPQKRCAIGPGVVVDPEQLVNEIDELKQKGLLQKPGALTISDRCQLVMPYHKLLDEVREQARGSNKIGTTLRGIGPCLADKASRMGVRMGELLETSLVQERLHTRLPELNAILTHYGREPLLVDNLLPKLQEWAQQLAPFMGDVGDMVRQEMDRSRAVLFEGAQGALLDIDHGTYPYVTSSNTVAAACCTGTGIGPNRVGSVMGIVKAYCTRVGAGPFPTELNDDRGNKLREKGAEFGATTGRPRRCGWLDLMALRYTCAVHGCTSLCITKLDVLGGQGPLQVAIGYELDGKKIECMPASARVIERIQPIYETLDGWDEEIDSIREMKDLPTEVLRYLTRIEGFVNLPIDLVSVGPSRVQTILRNNPFRRK